MTAKSRSLFCAVLSGALAASANAGLFERVADLNVGGWTERWGGLCGHLDAAHVAVRPEVVFGDQVGGGCRVFTVDPAGGSVAAVADLGESEAGTGEIYGAADGVTFFAGVTQLDGTNLWRTDGTAAGTFALLDSPGGESGLGWSSWRAVGSPWSYFVRSQPDTGAELWRTDGTREGTALVLDLRPGPDGSTIGGGVVWGSLFLFTADDGVSGPELWRTDGTVAGTFPLTNFSHDSGSVLPLELVAAPWGGAFTVYEPGGPLEFWRTDGTSSGTVRIWISEDYPYWEVPAPAVQGDRVLFANSVQSGSLELWVSNGTAAGTMAAGVLPNAEYQWISFAPLGQDSWLFFFDDGVHGTEPWVTDGTAAGPHLVADVRPGPVGSVDPEQWVTTAALDGRLLMTLDDGTHGIELWITDGTAAGTGLVADLTPGSERSRLAFLGERDGVALVDVNGDLWRTDGSAPGTLEIATFGGSSSPAAPSNFTLAGDLLYLDAWPPDDVDGRRPARSDGTAAGTHWLDGTLPAYTSRSDFSGLESGRVIGGSEVGEDTVIWSSLGEEMQPLESVTYPCGSHHFCPLGHAPPAVGPVALFAEWDELHGSELWATDGTPAGTGLFLDLVPGAESGWPEAIVRAGEEVWFTAVDAAGVESVWRSGGTLATTGPFAVVSQPQQMRVSLLWPLDVATERFFYWRRNLQEGSSGDDLWFSPGFGAPPALVRSGLELYQARALGVVGERLVFAAGEIKDPGVGREIWVSDGSPTGTRLLRDIWSGPSNSRATVGVAVADRVLFQACEPVAGCELWASDGTTQGTVRLLDIEPGPGSSNPSHLTRIGDVVYFSARRLETGREIWITDGTRAGTFAVGEIAPGPYASIQGTDGHPFFSLAELAGADPLVYFAGDDGTGSELWAMRPFLFYDGFESGDTSRWDQEPVR